ncbi:peptide/nickel transport system permease protein [Nocardiopsis sp. Huas11]|uniref:ABC transporter permease n=1 Tax=Nocardiopsis sp. Huas11 TaxID=2183912 RepID=UPI000EAE7607|nr:ABC transporter permease [Nocardiopsis sp. Huas11]RKS10396.1 peptide/nickel transport system permease protein [Nocardiopsis sp. Huas11]
MATDIAASPPPPDARPPASAADPPALPLRVWRHYLFVKVRKSVVVVFVVANVTFFLARAMPGDPIDVMAGRLTQGGMSMAEARVIATNSLAFDPDAPLWAQWWDFFVGLVTLDLGNTITRPAVGVAEAIAAYLPWTLFSIGVGTVVSIVLGLSLGMVMAYRRNRFLDHALSVAASVLGAVPNYLIAMLLVVGGGLYLGWFDPVALRGTVSPGVAPGFTLEFVGDAFYHAGLPILTYVLAIVGTWMLVMKASTTEVLSEDYVTVARARGLRDGRIAIAYVGRNAVLPLVAQIAISFGTLVGGAVFVERVLVYKGVGGLLLDAVNYRDYPLLQGLLIVVTACVVVANLVADLLYSRLDPRISDQGAATP